MSTFNFALLGLLHFLTSLALGSKCPLDDVSKVVVCYYEGKVSLSNFNLCNCTHIVFTNAVRRVEVNNISITEDAVRDLEIVKERKKNLSAIFTLETKEDDTSRILKSQNKSEEMVNAIADFLQESHFDGVEINFQFRSDDATSKESFAVFLKSLSKRLSSYHRRIKREGYDVFEKLDDITTVAYTTQTPKNSTSKTQSIKQRNRKRKDIDGNSRKESEEEADDYLTLDESVNTSESQKTLRDIEEGVLEEKHFLLFVRLSLKLEIIAKKYDLKALSRYSDILIVPTHDITSTNEEHLTYHPSRLMGLADILNTDSILDLLTGMGGLKSKMVISLPATVLKFELKDENKNTPRAPSRSKPQVIDQSQLCTLFSKSNWTVERDDDLTAPYAFSGKTWLAFEDEISVDIKGKYILLRELAGGAIYPIDADLGDGLCTNRTGQNGYLTGILHKNLENLGRKPRALVLESLQEEIHDTAYGSAEAGVKLSEYRIVRVVDHTGNVHVIRKNTKTQFECSRQGYFSHPLGCNKFYRCVKFDQYSDEFTVFEYDCPAGLAFDERWEVCVWPGSLPHGAPCTGSSEIAPVPRSHYRCPNQEGYYADPENCRWFFACLDHARDGITPLTAYEFRCPFGLVFSEERLACDWPWLVGSCGKAGAAGYLRVEGEGQFEGIHSATFINGGNLEASLGQYGNTAAASFIDFGSGFGSVLKGTKYSAGSSYGRSSQSAGFGYIASQQDDNHNRAAFASFPEYEVSGGRIVNKGGVVLDENVAGVSGKVGGGVAGVNIVGSIANKGRGFGKAAGHFNEENVQSVGGFHGGADITWQQLEPSAEITKTSTLKISGHSSAGQVQQQNSVSTPKPFSVNIPSVQINSEHYGHSTVEPTTPQSVLFTATTPQTENVNFDQQQQYSVSHGGRGFTVGQPTVSVNVPVVTPSTAIHAFGDVLSGSSLSKKPVSVSFSSTSFGTTPETETHRFGQSSFEQNEFLGKVEVSPAAVSTGGAVASGAKSFGYSLGRGTISTPVSVPIPVVTAKPAVHNFAYTSGAQATDFYKPASPTESSFTDFVQHNQAIEHRSGAGRGLGKSAVSVQIPSVQTQGFKSIGGGQGLVSGNAEHGQIGVSYGAPLAVVTQQIDTEGHARIGAGVHPPSVSSRPILSSSQQSSIDEKISNELYLNTPQSSFQVPSSTPKIELFSKTPSQSVTVNENVLSSQIPVVTPKPEFRLSQTGQTIFGVTGDGKAAVSLHNFPTVTPQNDIKYDEEHTSAAGGTPVAPISFSGLTTVAGNAGVSKEFPKVSYSFPSVTPESEIHTFERHESISQSGKTSYSIPTLTSEIKTEGVVQVGGISNDSIRQKISQPVQQTVYGQRYSIQHLANNFGSSGAIGSTPSPPVFKTAWTPLPKIQGTEISIEQQPVVSVGTVSSVTVDHGGSSPSPLPQNLPVSNIEVKSDYHQQTSVTTPAPLSSIIPSSSVTYEPPPHFLNVFAKSPQNVAFQQQQQPPKSIRVETSGPNFQETLVNVPDVTFDEKSSNLFQQEAKSLSPVTSVTESGLTSSVGVKSDFYVKSGAYLPPVTSKAEIFGQTFEQNFQAPVNLLQFGSTVQKQGRPSFGEKQVQFAAHQVTTTAPVYEQGLKLGGPAVTTSKPFAPQEKLVGLEITKSVEINPAEFFQSSGGYLSRDSLGKAVEIQQQPLHLISQKTFPAKQVIQPFYTQAEKEVGGNGYQEQYTFQQQVNVKTPKTEFVEQKQYLPPTVTFKPHLSTLTYSTPKTVDFGQPVTFSEEGNDVPPVLPVFEPSRASITSQKEVSRTSANLPPAVKAPVQTAFVSQQQEAVSPKANLLLPTTTAIPQFVSPQADEFSIHGSYNLQKINNVGPKVQTVFSQPEIHLNLKPLDVFGTSGDLFQYNRAQNLTAGTGNTIIESGSKYAINPNIAIPEPPKEYILAQNGFTTAIPDFPATSQSHSAIGAEFKGSTYLPPVLTSRRKPSKTTIISVGSLDEEDIRDDTIHQLFDKYSGRFGEVINGRNGKITTKVIKGNAEGEIEINRPGAASTVQFEISSTTQRPKSRDRQYHGGITSGVQATNKYEEYEINGVGDGQRSVDGDSQGDSKTTLDLKNLKLEKDKKTVIVVSQVSDANPILVGKLAGQCSCQSNMLELRTKGSKSDSSRRKNKNSQQRANISNKYLPPFESNEGEASSAAPEFAAIDGGKSSGFGIVHTTEHNYVSSSTTVNPNLVSSTILSSLGPDGVLSITPKTVYAEDKLKKKKQFRGRARFLPPVLQEDGSSVSLSSAVTASEIASTFDYSVLGGEESRSQNEVDGGRGFGGGVAFDRYGPGGWRGFDEVLQGSVDCKRPGLFRHPKYCNKFYACNYDPWKERYTLHVFNCPIQLTYDSSISACNWPVRGPACADDNLLL